jgi:hypothetical protein
LSLGQARGKQAAKRQANYYDLSILMHNRIPELSVLVGAANNITGLSGLKHSKVNQEKID